MKGDFSRDTFDAKKNFSRVLMQQGRVQLDADWNEQTAILLHYLQTLAKDLIGQHGGPGDGFKIEFGTKDNKPDLIIKQGRYYLDGILCENDRDVSYSNQPNFQTDDKFPDFPFLVYLDVWERHITCFEDESLREVALGGIDTTTRSRIVWQVKLQPLTDDEANKGCDNLQPPAVSNARLLARAIQDAPSDDPCNIEPDARYRGVENQLYRVEIHTGSVDQDGKEITPTFKWSRENGAVVFPVLNWKISKDTTEVRLTNLGRDDKFNLREGDWVELADDSYTLHNRAGNLLKIVSIDRDEMSVSLNGSPKFPISNNPLNHSLLRRWDQKAGNPKEGGATLNKENNAAEIIEGSGNNGWLKLEDGIEIQFSGTTGEKTIYRTGDYWLIPARTATGDVQWEKNASGESIPQLPRGIEHHYAPLGIAFSLGSLTLCRCLLKPGSICPPPPKDNNKVKGKNP